MGANVRDDIAHKAPTTIDERSEVAEACLNDLKLSMTFLLDDIEGTTEKAYSSWPSRMFVIDSDGKVVMKGPRGPGGVDLDEGEKAMKTLLKALPAGGADAPSMQSSSPYFP